MAVLSALRTAADAVGRNPILLVVAAAYGLVQLPQLLTQAFQPLLAGVVSLVNTAVVVFVLPFYFAGILGMANEAMDGRTSLATMLASGKRHYVSVFVVYLLLVGTSFVLGVVAVVVAFLGVGAWASAGSGGSAVLVVVGLVVLVVALAYLLVMFFVQFFGHAIVLDGLGAVDGVKRSVGVVRRNLLSVTGYSLLVGAVGALFGLVGAVFGLLTSPRPTGMAGGAAPPQMAGTLLADLPTLGLWGTLVVLLVYIFATGILGGFFAAYSTAFYREIRPATDGAGEASTSAPSPSESATDA